ncbi:MAG TPA: hypothetical protein VJO72_07295 [Candidatus Dormibacteraeota bacterium]|nr:hypothetical protein [Candidatus Dormibacteraeota bacterium]
MEQDAFRKACRGLVVPEELIGLGFGVAMAVDETEPALEDAP